MQTKLLPIICLMLFFFTNVLGECNCRKSQGGICSCKEEIARPQKYASGYNQPEISQAFSAIGDSCSCGNTIAQPAVPPKSQCHSLNLQPVTREKCQELQMRAPDSFQGPNVDPALVYGNKKATKSVPADAVSLSLAYQLARSLRRPVPEDKVQFGFQVEPLNGAKKVHSVNIPEEKLWTMNREVIELKATNIAVDSHEEDTEDDATEDKARGPGYLSYGDIGYCPEKYAPKTFSVKMPSAPYQPPCTNVAPRTLANNCGYSSGKVYHARYRENYSNDDGIESCASTQNLS